MVAMSMSHRYSTGRLVDATIQANLVDGRSFFTVEILLRDETVHAIVEDRHVEPLRRTIARKGVGCDVMMEHDGTWDEWTVHHVPGSATWAAYAEPRIKPIISRFLDMPPAVAA